MKLNQIKSFEGNILQVIVETPKGSPYKYDYDPEKELFCLNKVMPLGMNFPFDFGFVPHTKGEDGDPLDVLVLVDTPSFPGCVQSVRPIGALDMIDQGEGDEKILCVGEGNPRYNDVSEYSDIYPHILKEITHFFSIYKDLEGKRVEVRGWRNADFARATIVRAQESFLANKAKAGK